MRPNGLKSPQKEVSRRAFLKSSALVGGSLVVGFFVPAPLKRFAFAQEQPAPTAARVLPPANAFLRIGSDDSVTVLLAHSEMGQGIWTTLPMMVNEELDADWSRFRVEHAPAADVYALTVFRIQMTGGSTTTWSEFDRYRQVGAVARDAPGGGRGRAMGRLPRRLPHGEGLGDLGQQAGELRLPG